MISFFGGKFPKDVYQMNYNQLIESPEKRNKKNYLIFVNLNDTNCMKPEKNSKTIKLQAFSQVRQPINKVD